MGSDERTEPWVTDVPEGTTDDVIQVLVRAGLIEDLGPRTSRQRWKKPLTFAMAHGIRTGAVNAEALEILLAEARRILKGAKPIEAAQLTALVRGTYDTDGARDGDGGVVNPELALGAHDMATHNNVGTGHRACPGEGGTSDE